jgi:hypothetical protein
MNSAYSTIYMYYHAKLPKNELCLLDHLHVLYPS